MLIVLLILVISLKLTIAVRGANALGIYHHEYHTKELESHQNMGTSLMYSLYTLVRA